MIGVLRARRENGKARDSLKVLKIQGEDFEVVLHRERGQPQILNPMTCLSGYLRVRKVCMVDSPQTGSSS